MQQLPFAAFLPQTDWVAPRVADLPSWDSATRMAVDIETNDPDLYELGTGVRRDGKMVGVSFAFEDGAGYYLPYDHAGEGNLDKEHVLQYLADQAKNFTGIIAGANLSYDLDYLEENGVKFKPRKFRDVQVAEPILNEHRMKYSLDTLAGIYNIEGKDEKILREAAAIYKVHPKKELWKLPPRFVGAYAEQDAHLPLELLRKQERLLEQQDLWGIYDLESDLLPVLLEMTRVGIQVDIDRLDQMTKHLDKMMVEICEELARRSQHRIVPSNLMTASAIAPMIRSLGFKVPRTAKTNKDSITNDYLDTLDHPIAKMLVEARQFSKMKTTYCNSMYKYLTPKNRIHSTFNQLKKDKEDGSGTKGVVGGRLSSEDPNVQNQPTRHPVLGNPWRGIYIPDFGEWYCADFSQQEPRLTIHYSEALDLPGAAEAADRYRRDPNADSHQVMADLTGLPRDDAKQIFLALCYSMGEAKLCKKLGLPTEVKKIRGRYREVAGIEGKRLMNRFHEMVPFVKRLANIAENKAKNFGLITTLLGRAIHFPPDDWGNFDFTHKALNRLIQGSAADQMKKAMILANKEGFRIQLQVHDELDFSCSNDNEAKELAEIMLGAVELRVPSKVDLEMGPSWGEVKEKGRAQCKEFYAA